MAIESISHRGEVVDINPQGTTVRFISESACSSCHAAGLCGMSEFKEKTLVVPTDPRGGYAVGDEVEVLLAATMGFKAVWIAYMIPLAVLFAVFFGTSALGLPEVWAGVAAIGGVGLCYLGVYLLRDRLSDEYVFTIKKK